MSTVATVSDLQTFMNVTLDEVRAQQMLDIIEGFASAIVTPLPASALGVILTAAARAFPNPSGASSQSTGGASASWGSGGAYLTRSERLMLKRLGGVGASAFSINVAPGAGQNYTDPLAPPTLDDTEQFMQDFDLP